MGLPLPDTAIYRNYTLFRPNKSNSISLPPPSLSLSLLKEGQAGGSALGGGGRGVCRYSRFKNRCLNRRNCGEERAARRDEGVEEERAKENERGERRNRCLLPRGQTIRFISIS